ncbi:hypothetical protein EV182_004211, partial [Spiromyces aspiralis]
MDYDPGHTVEAYNAFQKQQQQQDVLHAGVKNVRGEPDGRLSLSETNAEIKRLERKISHHPYDAEA